jgi:hypothetical protein
MARRKARRSRKIEPAVKTLTFNFQSTSSNTVDLSQICSLVNRRFYRQGLNWAVAGFTFFTTGTGQIAISKIPDTWVASNAWHKGFASWDKMNRLALQEADSVKAKFTDFKVFMDNVHHTNGVAANLIPIDALANQYTLGEWDVSEIVIPDTTNPGTSDRFDIIWTGANYPGVGASGHDAVSLIEGYAASRGLPDIQDPNTPADAVDASGATPENWISGMFNEGTTQDSAVLLDLTSDNDQAPYPFENDGIHADTQYPGGANQAPGLQAHDLMFVTPTTIGGKTTSPGSNFQGGLIRIDSVMDGVGAQVMQIHLVPGPHRGYMCQPQMDV